jgi:hypothetical protein
VAPDALPALDRCNLFEERHVLGGYPPARSRRAQCRRPIVREPQAAGYKSGNAIAGQLNTRKVATARGGRWTHMQVQQIFNA